ncbi:MAG: T9SS type A sorting domain-containing protein [Flavobacteriales bacterium]|jgi:hypothetical protein|nr:T9SS type A sorting domain-containing protein [Flavobacteriales bacterium]
MINTVRNSLVLSAMIFLTPSIHARIGNEGPMQVAPPEAGGSGPAQGGSNTTCAGALINSLSLDVPVTVNGDNTGAVLDPVFGVPVVWEAFTTTSCADVTIGYCGTTPAFAASLITLAVGCPLTNFVFNSTDNIDPDVCGDGNYTVRFPNLPAGTYYFPVLQGTGSTGPYTITFTATACTATAPANATCGGAIELASAEECTPVAGSVAFATAAGNTGIGCGNGDVADGVWYSFEATATAYELTIAPSAQFNVHAEVFSGTCGALTGIGCAIGADFGVPAVVELNGLVVGETYYLRVDDWYSGSPRTTSFFICLETVTTIECPEDAGTITANEPFVCLTDGDVTISGTPGGDAVVPEGYRTIYLLSTTPDTVIVQGSLTPTFLVSDVDTFTIHTLVYDDETLDLNGLVFGTTTVGTINGLLVQGGGGICAGLDLPGAVVVVNECPPCPADAGTLEANASTECFLNGSATIDATAGGDMVVPTGFEVLYLLTTGQDHIIQQGSLTPAFIVTAVGQYTMHTLVYDPATLDLGNVAFNVTSINEVDTQLIQGGGSVCAALDMIGAPVNVEICAGLTMPEADAWSIWPNPNSGRFTVVGAGIEGAMTLQVLGPDGRLVHAQQGMMHRGTTWPIELPFGIGKGVYVVRMVSRSGVATQRLVLE